MPVTTLDDVFHPGSIAVAGSSNNPASAGYGYTRHLLDYGFRGRVYPVNPGYPEILGLAAYPRLRDVPGPVDYVISCLPAGEVLDMLADCPSRGVKVAQLFTARFAETGRPEASELEDRIVAKARELGVRLIGPNCMGLYYPKEGISFGYDFPHEPGGVAMVSQTGGGASVFIQQAALRGVRFSKVISYGNARDYDESDFLRYFARDPETRIITVYIEGVHDGGKLFAALREAASLKPVIVAKGGRGASGSRAAASHTASLAGSPRVWRTVVAQAGAIPCATIDEMVDLAAALYFLPPIRGLRVGLIGGGGGESVLSADQCEEAGLAVGSLPADLREELKTRIPALWDWLGNPTDLSILGGFDFTGGDMLDLMARHPDFDLLIANIAEGGPMRKEDYTARLKGEVEGYVKVVGKYRKPLMVAARERALSLDNYHDWRWELMCELRGRLIAAGIPVYPTVDRAARAARKLADFYRRRGGEG